MTTQSRTLSEILFLIVCALFLVVIVPMGIVALLVFFALSRVADLIRKVRRALA